jgi:outer membrane protein TolC
MFCASKLQAGLAYQADVLRAQMQLRAAELQLLRTRLTNTKVSWYCGSS